MQVNKTSRKDYVLSILWWILKLNFMYAVFAKYFIYFYVKVNIQHFSKVFTQKYCKYLISLRCLCNTKISYTANSKFRIFAELRFNLGKNVSQWEFFAVFFVQFLVFGLRKISSPLGIITIAPQFSLNSYYFLQLSLWNKTYIHCKKKE